MFLLASSRAVVRHGPSSTLPTELWMSSFHSSTQHLDRKRVDQSTSSTAPSRTRLVKDLTPRRGPKRRPGKVEVAPSREPFARDSVPHPEAKDFANFQKRPPRRVSEGGIPASEFGRRPRDYDRPFRERRSPGRHPREGEEHRSPGRYPREGEERRSPGRYLREGEERRSPDRYLREGEERRSPDRYPRDGEEKHGERRDTRIREERPARRYEEDTRDAGARPTRRYSRDGGENRHERRDEWSGDEFDLQTPIDPANELPTDFTSPPLIDGLLTSVRDILGSQAKPTPIQALSLKHLFKENETSSTTSEGPVWRQYLLASETGSGKSIAYFLPLLQDLKLSELNPTSEPAHSSRTPRAINPRALVLAPTHELSRQLATFAKALLHHVKLRVFCASRANVRSTPRGSVSASKMAEEFGNATSSDVGEEFEVRKGGKARPVDVLVGTPSKVLEMVRGRGWDWDKVEIEDTWETDERGKRVKPKRFTVGPSEMGLRGIEWVVVDEADVLFDPDFQESTRMLLADISAARGHHVAFNPELNLPAVAAKDSTPVEALNYPFNLILTTATIPSSLAAYIDTYHPSLTRLASPNLHHLPSTLKTEYASWTGGNRNADVEQRIRRIWHAEGTQRSKVLIFCNRSTKVEDLGRYLKDKGIPNLALTSTGEARKRGSNHHLDGFLRVPESARDAEPKAALQDDPEEPHVMITTSLLSRGLDFSPAIKNVFIVDEPRNMVDFLHRAGRSGRAGESGKVVVFGKMKGRGAGRTQDVKRKVRALAA